MKPFRITPPTETPITVDQAKAHMRLDGTDEDSLVESYIGEAVDYLDGFSGVLGRCICTQTWGVPFKCWMGRLKLDLPDVQSVVVKYRDQDDAEQTVADTDYVLSHDASGAFVYFKNSFASPSLSDDHPFPITVEATAGYGAAADVPETVKGLVRKLSAHFEYMREAASVGNVKTVPMGVEQEIAAIRWVRV